MHSKMQVEFMKNDMAHVLILNYYQETVYDYQKLIKSSVKVQLGTKKDICKKRIGFMTIDMVHGLLEVLKVVFDI